MHDLESLPEVWSENLTSLEELVIWSCSNLTSLLERMSHLTSLRTLDIYNCPPLELLESFNLRKVQQLHTLPWYVLQFVFSWILFFELLYLLQLWYFGQFIYNYRRGIFEAQTAPKFPLFPNINNLQFIVWTFAQNQCQLNILGKCGDHLRPQILTKKNFEVQISFTKYLTNCEW